jgi:hypothetical protein
MDRMKMAPEFILPNKTAGTVGDGTAPKALGKADLFMPYPITLLSECRTALPGT